MNTILLYPIALPILIGLICLFSPKNYKVFREVLSILALILVAVITIYICVQPDQKFNISWMQLTPSLAVTFDLRTFALSRLVLASASIFALLIGVYSLRFMTSHPRHKEYYAYFLLLVGMTSGIMLSNNLILLLFFWEMNGLLLFLMIGLNGEEAKPSATKTLMITGFGDLSLLLGIVFLWSVSGTLTISTLEAAPQILVSPISIIAFLLMVLGAFAKAGVMPLHSWIPAIAFTTPETVMAYLPASLDKLLGIYLLGCISLQIFVMTPTIGLILMIFGAITILGAVMMALIQKDIRKMLSFHAVSQVGYMVLGIGTGIPVGVIGGMLHMLNNAIYKSCLFLCGGSIRRQTGRSNFNELGGLASLMPWTFAACLISALAISGVPPMNGFASKWLIYQGILERGGPIFPIFLTVAMFGSALTLASFMKLLYSVFWGQRPKGLDKIGESPATLIFPMIVLALLSMILGIFYRWPVNFLLKPIIDSHGIQTDFPGLWQSELTTILLIGSLIIGLIIYFVGRPHQIKKAEVFLGGESLNPEDYRVPGTHFYGSIKVMENLKQIYSLAEDGVFDIYLLGVKSIKRASNWVYQHIDQALADFYQEIIPAFITLVGEFLRLLNERMSLTRILWVIYILAGSMLLIIPGHEGIITFARISACVGMVGWALLAWVEHDLRRLLVLACTSQFGFVVLALSLSSSVAISYLATSIVALLALYAVVFFIQRNLQTTQIEQLTGLAGKKPVAFIFFVLAALWLSGLPPFGSFFSKFLLGVATGEISPLLTITITGTAMMTLAYLLRPIRSFLRVE